MSKNKEYLEKLNDICHFLDNDDLHILYFISEIKNEFKNISEEKYKFWDKIHKLAIKKLINNE